MFNRREILLALGRLPFHWVAAMAATYTTVASAEARIRKRLVPQDADPDRLRNANPRYLDTRNLAVMPLDLLEQVGDAASPFNARNWQLQVDGIVKRPKTLDLEHIRSMPAVEKNALLVCQGVFAFHGRWKGIPLSRVIAAAEPARPPKACIIYGYSRAGERKERFKRIGQPAEEPLLVYSVNGKALGPEHGYPLRVVAPGRWGERWLKYVQRIEVV